MSRDLVIEDLWFQNFLSFGGAIQVVKFDEPGITVVIGENLDVGENERNGVGKSAISDALSYCWYGKSIRGLTNSELTNWDVKKRMLVGTHFRKDGFQYRIERGENPGILRLFKRPIGCTEEWMTRNEDGSLKYDISRDKVSTTREVERIIGIDQKLFEILILNSSESTPFFKLKEEDRRDIIERLFGFTEMSEWAEKLKDPIRKEANKRLIALEASFETNRSANARIEAEIKNLEAQSTAWEQQVTRERLQAKQIVDRYAMISFEDEEEILNTKKSILDQFGQAETNKARAKSALDAAVETHRRWGVDQESAIQTQKALIADLEAADPAADIAAIEAIQNADAALAAHTAAGTTAKAQFQAAEAQLATEKQKLEAAHTAVQAALKLHQAAKDSTCPTCGQEWHSDKDKLEHLAEEHATADKKLAVCMQAVNQKHIEVEELRETLNKARTTWQALSETRNKLPAPKTFKTVQEASGAEARINELRSRIEKLKTDANPHDSTVERLRTEYDAAVVRYTESEKLKADAAAVVSNFATPAQVWAAKSQYDAAKQSLIDIDQGVNPHKASIDRLRTDVLKLVDDSDIRALKNRIEHYNFLIDMLTNKNSFIRQSILSKWIPRLNQRLEYYLSALEHPYRVRFEPDMSANIIAPNGLPAKYNALSRGQRTRVWMSTNWAFQDVYEAMNSKINAIFLDELLDVGMSERGAERCYDVVEELAHKRQKAIFVITHRIDLADRAEKVMKVQMQHGVAKLVDGD